MKETSFDLRFKSQYLQLSWRWRWSWLWSGWLQQGRPAVAEEAQGWQRLLWWPEAEGLLLRPPGYSQLRARCLGSHPAC